MDWSTITEEILNDLYHVQMMTMRQIADLYETHNVRVLRKMKMFGIQSRDGRIKLYPCRDSLINKLRDEESQRICATFEVIGSSQAYLLGLLAADGNIYVNSEVTRISITSKDQEIVDIVCSVIGAGHINFRKDRNLYEWRYCNRFLAARLAEFNIVPRKSHILRYPNNLPSESHRHFIRGFFDGDGCITAQTQNRKPFVHFAIASKEFLIRMAEVMQEFAGTSARKISYQTDRKTGKIYFALGYASVADCTKIYDFLYAEGGERLTRKFNRFSSLLTFHYRTHFA